MTTAVPVKEPRLRGTSGPGQAPDDDTPIVALVRALFDAVRDWPAAAFARLLVVLVLIGIIVGGVVALIVEVKG